MALFNKTHIEQKLGIFYYYCHSGGQASQAKIMLPMDKLTALACHLTKSNQS